MATLTGFFGGFSFMVLRVKSHIYEFTGKETFLQKKNRQVLGQLRSRRRFFLHRTLTNADAVFYCLCLFLQNKSF